MRSLSRMPPVAKPTFAVPPLPIMLVLGLLCGAGAGVATCILWGLA